MVVVVFVGLLWLVAAGMLVAPRIPSDYRKEGYSLKPWSLIPGICGWLLLIFTSFTIVSPGNVGIPVAFGRASGGLGSGFHVVPPWATVHKLNVKVQNYTMSSTSSEGNKQGDDSVPVHTKDQVTVNVDSTALFRLTDREARNVYVNLGSDYVTQIIRPIIRSAIRDNATPYNAIDLATGDRQVFQNAVESQVRTGIGKYGIELVDPGGIQIRDIHLPTAIQDAVNAKAKAQQDVAQQQFVLQSKQAQQQQRIVDATGLAKSQTIIHSTLNPLYLQYLYITTLQDLAKSQNTTFLFLPTDPGQLPQFQIPLTTPSTAK